MSATLKFDQRATAVVELLGTTTECDDFEQALQKRRWPIPRALSGCLRPEPGGCGDSEALAGHRHGQLGLAANLWLIALAGLGYLQHLHWCVRDRWIGYTLLGFFALVLLTSGVWNFGLRTAAHAGAGAVRAAASGKAVDAYFGISPQWVCVRPIGPADGIHVDGGEFRPSRPYLKIGDASGTAVLWDPAEKGALKMPLDKLRIIPVDEPSKSCAPSA
ncbi:hypothetical protein [Streptomyces cyaneofuscatus]|uniref:hypothetical protein n=1 Tax=Streptomyces cyaneofuscatus TaxID=66883 RepID=UPI00365D974C